MRYAPKADFTMQCRRCGRDYQPTLASLHKGVYRCMPCRNAANRASMLKKRDIPPVNVWTQEELDLLAAGKPVPTRSKEAIRTRRKITGHTLRVAHAPWSDDDARLFRKLYPVMRCEDMLDIFPGRTLHALQARGSKLGLVKKPGFRSRSKPHRLTEAQRQEAPEAVRRAVPASIPAQVREEMISSMVLDVLAGKLAFKDIARSVKAYRTRVYAMFPQYGAPVSLDAPAFDDSATTVGDLISSDTFRF